jgi:hypothetical protein
LSGLNRKLDGSPDRLDQVLYKLTLHGTNGDFFASRPR